MQLVLINKVLFEEAYAYSLVQVNQMVLDFYHILILAASYSWDVYHI